MPSHRRDLEAPTPSRDVGLCLIVEMSNGAGGSVEHPFWPVQRRIQIARLRVDGNVVG